MFTGLPDPPVVVGVVGIGHVTGIVQKFNTVCPTDVAKVIQLPPTSRSSKYIKKCPRLFNFFRPSTRFGSGSSLTSDKKDT